jgi:catechol-2,3-dioxygenase
MKVLSLGWLGVRTKNSAAMTASYRDVLRLEVLEEKTTGARFCLADQTEVHVYDDDDEFHEFFGSAPVIGFLVDSFAEA